MSVSLLGQVASGEAPQLVRLTVDQYQQLLETGVFHDGDPIELIDGYMMWKDRRDSRRPEMTHGPDHVFAVRQLFQRVIEQVAGRACLAQCQLPIVIPPRSAPEPDVSVIAGGPEDFRGRLAGPDDVLAVMEVADSSRQFDRTTKQRLYADAGIPISGVVDLQLRQFVVYTKPDIGQGRYQREEAFSAGDNAELNLRDGTRVTIPVAEILP